MEYDDEYDYVRERHYRRPSPRRHASDNRRSQQFLDPGLLQGMGGDLARTRSQGARPNPIIINNEFIQDNNAMPVAYPPPRAPSPYMMYPMPVPVPEPEARGRRDRLGDELAEDFVDLAIENRRLRERSRDRSRSRGYSDAGRADRRDDYYEAELRRKERELAELQRKTSLDEERDRFKQEIELQRLRDEAKRKGDEAERKRILEDYEREERERADREKRERKRILDERELEEREKAEREKKERRRILDEHELEERERADKEKAERKRILDEERDKAEKAKEEEKRMRERIKQEEIDKKEKENKEWEEFMAKLKAKEEKEKADKKKKKDEEDEALRTRLLNAGYSKAYADQIVEEDTKKTTTTTTTTTALITAGNIGRPTYVKVHRDYLSIDTLRYYNLPWEYDKTDKNYIVILREISKTETDLLFEHTKSLRQGRLLLEPPKKEPQYAWVRKRDRSTSRVKKLAIVKYDE